MRDDFIFGWNFPWYRMEDRYISRFGLEYRHPFLDRRVIEYCLGLPPEQRRRGNYTKFVLRQAMRDQLPEKVRTRTTKAHYGNPTYFSVMEQLGGESFYDSLVIASLGWVDSHQAKKMYRHMDTHFRQNHPAHIKYLFPLWMICGVELWFRKAFVDAGIPAQWNSELCFSSQSIVN